MSRGEQGWQSDKTVLQRNRYMLEHEVAADVCFEVGTSKSTKMVLRAHRYMLISASPVFEAMFCGGLAETKKENESIKVEDIQGKTFKEMLRYIYYEESRVTGECALQLMYAAHKYMIPKLVKVCEKFLEDGLNDENVCTILEHSLTFGAEELKKRCLALIALNSSEIMKSKQFKEVNVQTLDAVLDMKTMECSESFVYQACISWAIHQLKNNQKAQNPSDQAIRDTLGKLLYKIRFPAMGQKEFTECTADSDVLSPQEKLSIFYFLANGKKKEPFPFTCEQRRKCSEKFCCRPKNINDPYSRSYMRQNYTGHNETLTFKAKHGILLTGIQLIPCNDSYSQLKHTFTVSISYQKQVIKQVIKAREDPNTRENKLVLTEPASVTKERNYTLTVTCSCRNTGYRYGYDDDNDEDDDDEFSYDLPKVRNRLDEYCEDESCAGDVPTAVISFPGPVRNQHLVSGLYYKL